MPPPSHLPDLMPRLHLAELSEANPNRDGSGPLVTVFTAGENGSWVDHLRVVATGPTTFGVIRVFVDDGGAAHLLHEEAVRAVTPSATYPVFDADIELSDDRRLFVLKPGQSLKAGTDKEERFKVFVYGGDYPAPTSAASGDAGTEESEGSRG